ncbi:MAG: MFS transporter [Phyllobacteriaceae bacterium]|jgi:predicted MFS family arabinose efflux permease|nr:MFS transporter [Phyllobacteriaceae bacterium]
MNNLHDGKARLQLWVLLLGNFIIGTGILLPAGLLNELSADLSITAATGGQLMLVGGIVVAIGAPLVAGLTSSIDRRTLLVFALGLYAAGHLIAAVVPDFTPLLVLRAITVLGAAIYTPQAAATAGLLVPASRRAGAIAFIFIGWSAASVAGIPLGSYLSTIIGWRSVMAGMGVACLLAALLVARSLPRGLFVQPLGLSAWKQALSNPVLLIILLVTLLSMSGQMTVFSYIAPILREAFAGGPEQVAIAFAVAGVSGVIGNAIAARVVAQLGIDRVIAISIFCLIIGLGTFAASYGNFVLALIGIGLWGLGSFSSNSLQQSRLVAIAPAVAAATVALNTSVVYVGQAIGAGLGGWFVAQTITPSMAWTACALTVAALAASLLATRAARR